MTEPALSTSDGVAREQASLSPLLKIEDLSVGYFEKGNPVPHGIVHGVSLTVSRHEVLGLVGESGSGKTQTARAILRVNTRPLRPLSGHIYLDGLDLLTLERKPLREVRGGRVAMIFQDPRASLNPLMRIGDQLARIYALHKKISYREAHREALVMLRRVGIAGQERVARSYPHQLSGGMCQRVMIGLCVGMNPELLIADEPTTGLDVTIQAQILELLQDMQAQTAASILLITHDLGVVAQICHRVAVMYAGRIVEIASVRDLFHHPRHPYTLQLLRASVAVEAPEKQVSVDSEGTASSVDIAVGSASWRASLESAADPTSDARMVEVSPGHFVLCSLPDRAGEFLPPAAARPRTPS